MTELEKMQTAKMYIDKLANGVDPITDYSVPDNTVLNNINVARCFFYVSQVLDKAIQNDGKIGISNTKRKLPFSITKEQIESVKISKNPICISNFCGLIDDAVDNENMKKLLPKKITDWLISKELLQRCTNSRGRKRIGITKNSKMIGITEEHRFCSSGPYIVNLYDSCAQQFILDNLESILEEN